MNLATIRTLVADDVKATDELICTSLHADVDLARQVGEHIINSGGKRLRPLLVLLCARALNYQGSLHQQLATIIEYIHTATLLHDDVIDESKLRRGRKTANAVWGNAASVLSGDFLYSRAFQMMVKTNNIRVMEVLANASNQLAEGELQQLVNAKDPNVDEAAYMRVIYCKTARLFEAAAQLAAVVAGGNAAQETAMAEYGKYLGMAFQLIDDAMDYNSSAEEMGKTPGDDLAEGKPTLPVVYAIAQGNDIERQLLRNAIQKADVSVLSQVQEILHRLGALDYTTQKAEHYADLAKKSLYNLADSPYKQALLALCDMAVHRRA
jgi:octaprenyl-diphosphate synthase